MIRLTAATLLTLSVLGAHADGTRVERWTIRRPGGLDGQRVTIEGSALGVTDVIARVVRLDGSTQVERLSVEEPWLTAERPARTGDVAWSHLVLGV
jgi:hypothetical protein